MTDTQARHWEYKLVAAAAGCVGFAVLAETVFPGALADSPPGIPVDAIFGTAAAAFGALAVLMLLGVWVHHRWFFSGRQRLRRELGGDEGFVDVYDLRETCGPEPVIREGHQFWGRQNMTVEQAGWAIGEPVSGRWPVRSQLIYAAFPRSAVIVGPQGAGKSQYIIPIILDLPGAAVVTSTKPELLEATGALRSRVGPVYVFDPQNMTGGRDNFPFDPVLGCQNHELAELMAEAMIRGASLSKSMREEFWTDAGREILRCYLLAAAIKPGGTSYDVQRWTHDPDNIEPAKILGDHQHLVPDGWLSLLQVRLRTNRRQRDGYFGTVSSCMDYLGHPGGKRAVMQAHYLRRAHGDNWFVMEGFLADRCTLFIVGDKTARGMAPMMTALTESLAYRARHAEGGLREPLVMMLDEVANITPVDLPRWTTEHRGSGVMPFVVIQSRSQLDKTWGAEDGRVIWDNLVTKLVMPSLGDEDFLEGLSRLAGQRKVPRVSETTRGGDHATVGREPVIPLHVIRALPQWHAYTVGVPRHAAVVTYEPGYRRLERERAGTPWRPAWPRWWRHPIRATLSALELDKGRHR